ncbi:hypothetical protein ACXR0O_10680 [Verrucomicrobiota bacterium sgz303538]
MKRFYSSILLALTLAGTAWGESPSLVECKVDSPPIGDVSEILKIGSHLCSFRLSRPVSHLRLIIDTYKPGQKEPTRLVDAGVGTAKPGDQGKVSIQIADLAYLPLKNGTPEELLVSHRLEFSGTGCSGRAQLAKTQFNISKSQSFSAFSPRASVGLRLPLFYVIGDNASNSISGQNDIPNLLRNNPTACIMIVSLECEDEK